MSATEIANGARVAAAISVAAALWVLYTTKTNKGAKAMENDKQRKPSYKLRLMGAALCKELTIYEQMQNGEIPLLPETEKTLQTSIKELCKAIVEKI